MANVSIYKNFKIACICLLIIFNFQYPLFSHAQSDADRMFKKYTTRDGMLSNSVYAMERSKNGLWWIGTAVGLQRFDGYSFENWAEARDKSTVFHRAV